MQSLLMCNASKLSTVTDVVKVEVFCQVHKVRPQALSPPPAQRLTQLLTYLAASTTDQAYKQLSHIVQSNLNFRNVSFIAVPILQLPIMFAPNLLFLFRLSNSKRRIYLGCSLSKWGEFEVLILHLKDVLHLALLSFVQFRVVFLVFFLLIAILET